LEHEHQWVLRAGPWPVYQKVYERKARGNHALVDTLCRFCRLYKAQILHTRGEWTSKRTNRAMQKASIWWT
jgi:hypothetical protein